MAKHMFIDAEDSEFLQAVGKHYLQRANRNIKIIVL